MPLGHISYTIEDADGEMAAVPLYDFVGPTATVGNLQSAADAITPLLDAILDGKIITIRACIDLVINGAKASAVAGAPVERTGLFSFKPAVTKYRYSPDIPGFKGAKLIGDKINLADTDVLAFTALFSAATIGGAPVKMQDKYGNDLLSVISGRESFRKHR